MVFVVVGSYQGVRVFFRAFVSVFGRVVVSAVSCFTKAGVDLSHLKNVQGIKWALLNHLSELKNWFACARFKFRH